MIKPAILQINGKLKTERMKSNKQHKGTKTKVAHPAYGEQDFDQGRAGMQSGFEGQAESFSQFQNAGDASFAGERTANPIQTTKPVLGKEKEKK